MTTEHTLKPPAVRERNIGFDILRIAATFAVMILHVAAYKWSKTDYNTFAWNTFNVYDSLVRWAVPVFVMISGALFLNAENSIEKMYKKYILRIFTAFVFWSFLYAAFGYYKKRDLLHALRSFVCGNYHLWFLFMIVGLYMITPLLKKLVEDMKLTKYFLVLSFIFSLAIPEMISFLNMFSVRIGGVAQSALNNMRFHFAVGFTFYYVMGYLFTKITLTKKQFRIICILGVIGFIATIALSAGFSYYSKSSIKLFYDNMTVNVALEAIFVFSLYTKINNIQFSEKAKAIILKLSKYSFGAYLVHDFFIKGLDFVFHFNTLSINPVISVAVISVITLIGSFAVSAVINHIPVLKKYIV